MRARLNKQRGLTEGFRCEHEKRLKDLRRAQYKIVERQCTIPFTIGIVNTNELASYRQRHSNN